MTLLKLWLAKSRHITFRELEKNGKSVHFVFARKRELTVKYSIGYMESHYCIFIYCSPPAVHFMLHIEKVNGKVNEHDHN